MNKLKTEGTYLRRDLKEYINESFAKRYNVNLENWVSPYAYWDQFSQQTLSIGEEAVPDGTYVLFGKVSYPGTERMSHHHIFQFNLAKLRGADIQLAAPFNIYPNVPPTVPLRPVFPMFKVDQVRAYKAARKVFYAKLCQPLSTHELERLIIDSNVNSIENKLYRIRLAVQLDIDKEKGY